MKAKKRKKEKERYKHNKMTDLNITTLINALNVYGLNTTVKRQVWKTR